MKRKPGHGGRRPGAGPKPKNRLEEEYLELGPPPPDEEPLARSIWAQKIASLCLWRVLRGLETAERAGQIRAGVNTVIRAVPAERLYAAEKIIRGRTGAPEERGPELVPVKPGGPPPLHGSPPGRRPWPPKRNA